VENQLQGCEVFRGFKLKDTRLPGLVSQYGAAEFHLLELVERKGKGTFLRGAPKPREEGRLFPLLNPGFEQFKADGNPVAWDPGWGD